MSMVSGDITASSGLAKRIYDGFAANAAACGFGASLTGDAANMMKAQAFVIASAVVAEITANAEAVITTSNNALQRVAGIDTDAPSSERVLTIR